MNRTKARSIESNNSRGHLWVAASWACLGALVVGVYLLAWPEATTWQWAPALSLAALFPLAVVTHQRGRDHGLLAALVASVSLWPVIGRGMYLGRPAGSLITLTLIALSGPLWTYLLSTSSISSNAQLEQQSEQISYLCAMSDVFRVQESLPKMLDLTARSIGECMGYAHVLIGLAHDETLIVHNEGVFGLPPSMSMRLRQERFSLDEVRQSLRPEFALDQSFLIPGQHASPWTEMLRACSFLPAAGEGPGYRDLLVLPIYDREREMMGFIALLLDPTTLSRHQVQTLQMIAQQTATAIDNYWLREDLERHVQDLTLINDVGQAITAGLDYDSILQQLVSAGTQLLNGDYGALYLWDDERWELVLQASYGTDEHAPAPFEDAQVAAGIESVMDNGLPLLLGHLDSAPVGSLLAVPLVDGARVRGVLTTATKRGDAFDRTDQILLSTLADQASIAMKNARLYENTIRQVHQLATLSDLGQTILSSLDIEITLDQILAKVQQAFEIEAGSVLLAEQDKLVFYASFGPVKQQIMPLTLEMGQGIAGYVAENGTSILVPDVSKDTRHFAEMDRSTGFDTRSLLCVPLKNAQDQVIGVLEIMNPLNGRPFTEQDKELLESVATFAVIAIQNAQLYEQTLSHVVDLSLLYNVGKALSSSLDVRETIDILVRETAGLTEASRSRIVLLETQNEAMTHAAQHGYESDRSLPATYAEATQGLTGWVLHEKVPTMSADLARDERMNGVDIEQIGGADAKSAIIAPLLIKGEPVGALSAIRTEEAKPFTERELGLLNMLAGQAAVALENAHLFEERKRQITELSILNQTGQALSSTLEPEDLIELIHSQVAQVMDADNFYIALYDAEQEQVSFPLAYEDGERQVGPGLPPQSEEWQPRTHGQGLTEYVIQTRQALWLPNNVSERLCALGVDLLGTPAQSWLGVPILWDKEILGVIAVQSHERQDVYDSEHLELLMTIAGQASAAIRNARLFARVSSMTENLESLVAERTEALAQANQELTVERDRLNVLYQITRELSSSLDPEQSMDHTLELICQALQAEHGYILLADATNKELVYRAVYKDGASTPNDDGSPFPRRGDRAAIEDELGVVGWPRTRQAPIRIGDISSERRWQLWEGQDRRHRSLLAVPLLAGGQVTGAIILYHSDRHHFTADHQRMLEAIASQAAVAASNTEMFQLLREAADRLSNMLRAQQLEAAKSHAILEGVADGVMVTDAHGEIILFNAAAERILQIHRTDVIGRSVSEMPGIFGLAGTSWAELTEMWGEGNPDPDREVLYDERLELDQRVISMRVAPVTRENVFEGTVSVFRDITKDVEVDRMKSEFVSTVSHELRTPMTSIKGYIDLMYSGMAGNITPKQERFLQIVKTNADRLTLLVNDLLDISRIEMGRLKLNPKPVELSNTVDVVLDNHAPEAQQRQQTLRNEIEDPLPLVQVDPARLAQVLTNLVSNAVHYTPNGGSISVRAEVVDDVVQIHVQDTGIGIKEEDKSKLFSRFYRAEDPLVQARSGTGLGLVIVKSIVELHGGEMWFESTPGQGSTFSLSLPLAEKATETPPRQFKTISYRPHDKHILIIEGEPKVAERISYQLQAQERYQIHVERSGQAAVEYLIEKQRQPDLILLDLDLPDMEGLDVLRTIQSHERLSAIPIVTLSLSLEESDGKARISRPMRANDLVNAVNAVFAESADDLDVRRRKVLLVEDDEQLAELFTVVLTQKGFMVTINKEPHQALALAIKDRPDLVLLDLTRADQVGYDILDQLKHTEATQDIPVLVITGEALDLKERSRQDLDVMSIQLPEAPVQVDEFVSDVQSALTSDAQTSSSN